MGVNVAMEWNVELEMLLKLISAALDDCSDLLSILCDLWLDLYRILEDIAILVIDFHLVIIGDQLHLAAMVGDSWLLGEEFLAFFELNFLFLGRL